MRAHIALSVVSVLVLLAGVMLASEEVLITFPQSIVGMTRHGNCLVVVHYRADDRNRKLELLWDSPDGESGSSETDITPENNGIPVVKDLDLSSGRYAFKATLFRSDGSMVMATSQTRFVTR